MRAGEGQPGGVSSPFGGATKVDRDRALRDVLKRVALEFPSDGWPRMTKELKRRGWALDRELSTELSLQAVGMALAERWPAPDLVHHSDRGVP